MNEATLFMDGDSQAVRLPDGFRLPGTTVRVTRSGQGLLLEPIAEAAPTPERIKAILAELDRLAEEHGPFMPEGRNQPVMPPPDDIASFDDVFRDDLP